tara:strand:- start:539 stop:784 length:246 start_codon:yes stop_codon:yes gene_type:complete
VALSSNEELFIALRVKGWSLSAKLEVNPAVKASEKPDLTLLNKLEIKPVLSMFSKEKLKLTQKINTYNFSLFRFFVFCFDH